MTATKERKVWSLAVHDFTAQNAAIPFLKIILEEKTLTKGQNALKEMETSRHCATPHNTTQRCLEEEGGVQHFFDSLFC